MTTSFNDIFEQILEDGHVDVAVTGSDAESLRTSLVRRWNVYKRQYDSLGFLTEERKNQSMCMERVAISVGTGDDEIIGTRYLLKMKKGRVNYTILPTSQPE